jgi:rubrerythrin
MGKIGRFFRHLGQRAVLRSALNLEEEIHGLYESLKSELDGERMPEELLRVLSEEQEHKRLLLNILEGRIPEEEAQLVLSKGRFHDLERVEPLDARVTRSVWQKLLQIREREAEIRLFFRSICAKTKLPSARKVLCFLADQEDVHVRLLDRLLGDR